MNRVVQVAVETLPPRVLLSATDSLVLLMLMVEGDDTLNSITVGPATVARRVTLPRNAH